MKKHFDLPQSLFGIPFILGTLFFGSIAAMSVCGKVTVTVDGDRRMDFLFSTLRRKWRETGHQGK